MLSHGENVFQTFSPNIGNMIKIENFLYEAGEIFILPTNRKLKGKKNFE